MDKKMWLLVITILLLPFITAQDNNQYHLKLLAVQESAQGYEGSEADLYLELKEGSGRVFLETFPLTQMDTQISTRFAKETACNHFKLNCDQYDFFYTIKAKTNIIGGPSAGAAIAALTTIAILDLEYNQKIAITGTINSGGIVGPVGGVKEKITAAAKAGLTKVLIAKGTAQQKTFSRENNQTNISEEINLIDYGRENLSLEVVEVINLDEIIVELTGKELNHKNVTIQENEEYNKIMSHLQKTLCNRTKNIEQEIKEEGITLPTDVRTDLLTSKGRTANATLENDYYSAASFCFGTNIQLKSVYYQKKNVTLLQLHAFFNTLARKTNLLEEKMEQERIETISDLQTAMIVKERLNDVHNQLKEFNSTKITASEAQKLLAYAEERYFSAVSWMEFFQMSGKKFILDRENLQTSCQLKIAESEERLQYVSIFLPGDSLSHIRNKIEDAQSSLEKEKFELCLITAAQAKADADAIISSIGITDEAIDEFIQAKQKAVERIIFDNSAEGMFPILGYSYYRYALSLQDQDKFSALLYLEYALEMSDLGIYFPEEKTFLEQDIFAELKIPLPIAYISIGFILGVLLMLFLQKKQKKQQ